MQKNPAAKSRNAREIETERWFSFQGLENAGRQSSKDWKFQYSASGNYSLISTFPSEPGESRAVISARRPSGVVAVMR